MQVTSKEEAWCLAKRIFPTGYMLDRHVSKNAGYDVYYSTEGNSEWISDLGCALELNMKKGTIRINIVEEKEPVMTATVYSLANKFESYKIDNVFKVRYLKQKISVLYTDCKGTHTSTFSASDVYVEVTV